MKKIMKKSIFALVLVAGATAFVSCDQKNKATDLAQKAQDVVAAVTDSANTAVNVDSLTQLPVAEKLAAYQKYGTELSKILTEVKAGNTAALADYQKHMTLLQELGTQLQKDVASFTPEQKKQFEEVLTKVQEAMKAQK